MNLLLEALRPAGLPTHKNIPWSTAGLYTISPVITTGYGGYCAGTGCWHEQGWHVPVSVMAIFLAVADSTQPARSLSNLSAPLSLRCRDTRCWEWLEWYSRGCIGCARRPSPGHRQVQCCRD